VHAQKGDNKKKFLLSTLASPIGDASVEGRILEHQISLGISKNSIKAKSLVSCQTKGDIA
jgi:hypothetical protein